MVVTVENSWATEALFLACIYGIISYSWVLCTQCIICNTLLDKKFNVNTASCSIAIYDLRMY